MILPSFSQNTSQSLFPKRLWTGARTISFRIYKLKVALLVIYLFNHDSSKATFFLLNMAFDVLLSTVFVKFEFFVSCNINITRTFFFFFFALCFDVLFYQNLIVLHHGNNSSVIFWHLCQFTLSTIISTMKKW